MKVLVFGGSNFAGRATVASLVRGGAEVTLFNRGKAHWGDANPLGVRRLAGNRKDHAAVARALRSAVWSGIVDFTSFDLHDFAPLQAFFRECAADQSPFYVFISSDNVYNLAVNVPRGNVLLDESACVRPADAELRAQLAEEDDYGDGKLCIEEELHRLRQECGLAFAALRCPDIYGPYDGHRFWAYFCWLSVGSSLPVYISEETAARKLSFVYCDDVARVCELILTRHRDAVGSFNISSGTIELKDFLTRFAKFGQMEEPTFFSTCSGDAFCDEFLPSVDYCIDDSALRQRLPDFEPTTFDAGIEAMAKFYLRAWDKYPAEREDVLQDAFGEEDPKIVKLVRKKMTRHVANH